MGEFQVDPDRLSQFGARNPTFCLVTTAGRENDFKVLPAASYEACTTVMLEPGETLESLLSGGRVPADADVLVACPDSFLASPSEQTVGQRRLAVLPCGSTPTTDKQIAYFLDVLHRTDIARQEAFCAQLADALENTETLDLKDNVHHTEATFAVNADYEWNQQAGVIERGEQQVAPPGEFSALPTDINSFDATRRLGLTGSLTVFGPPIVHRANRDGLLGMQQMLFTALDTTRVSTLRIDVEDGVISDWRPMDPTAEPAAEALYTLFDLDERYRIVWEFGIGCNEAIEPQEGNCGMNEMYGSQMGVLHIGLGLTPTTDYAITLSCRQTRGVDAKGKCVFGAVGLRMNRTRSASCGCVG